MADILIASTTVQGSNSAITQAIAGVALIAGKMVYIDSADGRCKLADNNGTSLESRATIGMTANTASIGQPVDIYLTGSEITMNAAMVAGTPYFLSSVSGGICPFSDLTTGMQVQLVGIARSSTVLAMSLFDPDVAL